MLNIGSCRKTVWIRPHISASFSSMICVCPALNLTTSHQGCCKKHSSLQCLFPGTCTITMSLLHNVHPSFLMLPLIWIMQCLFGNHLEILFIFNLIQFIDYCLEWGWCCTEHYWPWNPSALQQDRNALSFQPSSVFAQDLFLSFSISSNFHDLGELTINSSTFYLPAFAAVKANTVRWLTWNLVWNTNGCENFSAWFCQPSF